MQYFKECKTIEEVKALYKQLAKAHHPDAGGDTDTMQAINTAYAFACAMLAKGAGLSDAEADEQIVLSELYQKVINAIIHLPGIVIEVVGNWIWVTGNTIAVKEDLKAAGLFFAKKKVAWYYRSPEFKTRCTNASLGEIRKRYGSQTVHNDSHSKTLE